MNYQAIPCGPYDTLAYVLSNDRNEALIIDAPPESFGKLISFCSSRQLKPLACLITHPHWDHMLDAWQFQAAGIPVYAHTEGKDFMVHPEFPGLWGLFPL